MSRWRNVVLVGLRSGAVSIGRGARGGDRGVDDVCSRMPMCHDGRDHEVAGRS